MATNNSVETRTMLAGEDLSSSQFHFCTLEADGYVDLADSAGEQVFGVILSQEADAEGDAVTVAIRGRVSVEAGGSITAGDMIYTNAAGEAVNSGGTATDKPCAFALEDGVDGQVIAVELFGPGNYAVVDNS
jgi:hypothetical protein